MQTFITDTPEWAWGVDFLDQKRLVKQLLECRQIMAALAGETKGWVNHPATKMWRGKEAQLFKYSLEVAKEMANRGYEYRNNLRNIDYLFYKNVDLGGDVDGRFSEYDLNRIIYTHRGRLYEKDPEYYLHWYPYADFKKYVCCDRCNYYWPTHLEK
jgi:hypothetical protein